MIILRLGYPPDQFPPAMYAEWRERQVGNPRHQLSMSSGPSNDGDDRMPSSSPPARRRPLPALANSPAASSDADLRARLPAIEDRVRRELSDSPVLPRRRGSEQEIAEQPAPSTRRARIPDPSEFSSPVPRARSFFPDVDEPAPKRHRHESETDHSQPAPGANVQLKVPSLNLSLLKKKDPSAGAPSSQSVGICSAASMEAPAPSEAENEEEDEEKAEEEAKGNEEEADPLENFEPEAHWSSALALAWPSALAAA